MFPKTIPWTRWNLCIKMMSNTLIFRCQTKRKLDHRQARVAWPLNGTPSLIPWSPPFKRKGVHHILWHHIRLCSVQGEQTHIHIDAWTLTFFFVFFFLSFPNSLINNLLTSRIFEFKCYMACIQWTREKFTPMGEHSDFTLSPWFP